MKKVTLIKMIVITCSITWGIALGWEGPAGIHFQPRDPLQESLYRAGRSVDEAWEAFHHAALGGTLASPALQTKIEEALHESRRLLVEARVAAQASDDRVVSDITERIGKIARQIKEDSQRQKP